MPLLHSVTKKKEKDVVSGTGTMSNKRSVTAAVVEPCGTPQHPDDKCPS